MSKQVQVESGFYEHYKRNPKTSFEHGRYFVIGESRHTETDEALVTYFPLYSDPGKGIVMGRLSNRPLSMWHEIVEYNGEQLPRFVQVTTHQLFEDLAEHVYRALPQYASLVENAQESLS